MSLTSPSHPGKGCRGAELDLSPKLALGLGVLGSPLGSCVAAGCQSHVLQCLWTTIFSSESQALIGHRIWWMSYTGCQAKIVENSECGSGWIALPSVNTLESVDPWWAILATEGVEHDSCGSFNLGDGGGRCQRTGVEKRKMNACRCLSFPK